MILEVVTAAISSGAFLGICRVLYKAGKFVQRQDSFDKRLDTMDLKLDLILTQLRQLGTSYGERIAHLEGRLDPREWSTKISKQKEEMKKHA